jgi:hypothetical protein
MHDNDKYQGLIHELWLIYCQLRDAEIDSAASEQLVASARSRLGQAVNAVNKLAVAPKSPRTQADNLNCRRRQKGLTPDTGIACD